MQSGTSSYGNNTWQTLVSGSVSLSSAGLIFVGFTGSHAYSSGPQGWNLRIKIDGTIISSVGNPYGAAGYTDAVSCSGSASVGSGSHSVDIEWFAQDYHLSIYNDTTFVQGAMK